MAQYEESQIEFAILSLGKDPLIDLLSDLAQNVKGLIAIQSRLDILQPDWKSFMTDTYHGKDGEEEHHVLTGPDGGLGLTEQWISQTPLTDQIVDSLLTESTTEAIAARRELITAQGPLTIALQDEIQSRHSEEERASARTRDFGAKMQKFARKVKAKEIM